MNVTIDVNSSLYFVYNTNVLVMTSFWKRLYRLRLNAVCVGFTFLFYIYKQLFNIIDHHRGTFGELINSFYKKCQCDYFPVWLRAAGHLSPTVTYMFKPLHAHYQGDLFTCYWNISTDNLRSTTNIDIRYCTQCYFLARWSHAVARRPTVRQSNKPTVYLYMIGILICQIHQIWIAIS